MDSSFALKWNVLEHQSNAMMINLKSAEPIDLLKLMHKKNVLDIYRHHMEITSRIFLTIPVTTVSREGSFSKLKLIKHITSAIGQ